MPTRLLTILTVFLLPTLLLAQPQSGAARKPKKKPAPFRWVNQLPQNSPDYLHHGTFHSPAHAAEIGYVIMLPPGYDQNAEQRYPVIYWLHGGRPGSETKAIKMAPYFYDAMTAGKVPPIIYVFPNGGKLSHYDHGDFKGEQAFLELIKHVDQTYRTIADRSGRAVEGFSQGGRGTARYLFKHPDLFCSAAPMGGGHESEKRISENNGAESNSLTIVPATNNTWDLAKQYAESKGPRVRILVAVGDEGFNFENNKAWTAYLTKLGVTHEFVIAPGVPHSSQKLYDVLGTRIIDFHVESFRQAGAITDRK